MHGAIDKQLKTKGMAGGKDNNVSSKDRRRVGEPPDSTSSFYVEK